MLNQIDVISPILQIGLKKLNAILEFTVSEGHILILSDSNHFLSKEELIIIHAEFAK